MSKLTAFAAWPSGRHRVRQGGNAASLQGRRQREKRAAGQLLRQLKLVATSLDAPINGLSGGNQQKVIFARALLAKPKLLICDEPTRGVDVGAKEEIYALLRQLAADGVAIIVISSEFTELLALCTRLAIVRHGRIQGVIANTALDEHRLMEIVTGAVDIASLGLPLVE